MSSEEIISLNRITENQEDNTLDAAMLKIIRDQASNKNYKFE